jgi:hypothetical protein
MTPTPTPTPTSTDAPRPRSEAQRAASRRNGANSRGPASAAGKNRSRRNAVKHGFAGTGAALPEDLERELPGEIALFERQLRPANDLERRLVEQAALGSLRLMRLARAEDRRAVERVRHARERWDAAREAEITALAARLETSGFGAAESATRPVLEALGRTAEGCDWLADAWEELIAALDDRGAWDARQATRAACLLGRRASGPRPEDAADWREFWSDVAACRVRGEAAAEAAARLRGIAEDRIAELVARGDELWRTQDGPDRAEAPDRALFDETPEGARLARYLNDAARLQHRALTELRRLRREAARGGPAALGASDDGAEGSSEPKTLEASRVEHAPAAEPVPPAPAPAPAPVPHAPRETNPAPAARMPVNRDDWANPEARLPAIPDVREHGALGRP